MTSITLIHNNFINPMIDQTELTTYYKSPLPQDTEDKEAKEIIQILCKQKFIDSTNEKAIEGLKKTFNIAQVGLNVFSKDIPLLRNELENKQSNERDGDLNKANFLLLTSGISLIACGIFVALGLVWVASYVIPISSPLSIVKILTGITVSFFSMIISLNIGKNELVKKGIENADKKYSIVFSAIDNFDHDGIIAAKTMINLNAFILEKSDFEGRSDIISKIEKIYPKLVLQQELRNTLDRHYPSKF